MTKTQNSTSAKSSPPSFEAALGQIEGIVASMEAGQLPLQEALNAYQQGMKLLQHCRATLDDAEQQIRILDEGALRTFDADIDADANKIGR